VAVLAACVAMMVGAGACGAATQGARQVCGPYGDPPAKTIAPYKPYCWGGKRLGPWQDADGTQRYACLYEPSPAQPRGRFPMIVYLHPSLFGVETIHLTNLLHYQSTVSLRGDVGKAGFIVLAPEGRKTDHYYPFPDNRGVGWDNWYRQLNPAGDVRRGATVWLENVDAAAIDHFIAQEVAGGKVDTNRIYVTGWSNGAAMAYLYALNRPRIAAVAVYSPPDPFRAFDDPCPQTPVDGAAKSDSEVQIFNPRIPTMMVHNNCDVVGLCPNSEQLAHRLKTIGVSVEDIILDSLGGQVSGCMNACGVNPDGNADPVSNPLGWTLGLTNHSLWPRGWTTMMLEFLRGASLRSERTVR
jgi:poly(3-hydroxybutyrate) depolymerase